jgi:hypothetical protein
MAKAAAIGAASVATWLAVARLMIDIGADTAEKWRGPLGHPHGPRFLYLTIALILPTLAAGWVASRLARRTLDGASRARVARIWGWVAWPLVAGYLVTAAFGSPAVHNAFARDMLSVRGQSGMLLRCIPEVDTYAAVPLLPGVVVSYLEAGDTCGNVAGGFLVHLWSGMGVTQVAAFSLWGGP